MSTRLRILALPVVLPLMGLVLMVVAMAVPDRAVVEELYEAVETGSLTENAYSFGYTRSRLDGFSECKRITIGLGATGGLLDTAIETPSLGPCRRAVPKIVGWAQGEGLTQTYAYRRYWNGSAVVFRPTIAAVGLNGARILAAVGVVAAATAFWVELARRVGRPSATVALVPLVATTDFIDLPGALLHALGMTVALAAAALMLRFVRGDPLAYGAAAFTSGAVFLFFGDMTNPDAAWVLTACAAGVVAVTTTPTLSAAVWRTAAATAGWILGFAWMWASKWIIAAALVGIDDVWSEVTGQVEFRLSGETEGGYTGALFGSLRGALRIWSDQPLMVPVLVVASAAAIVIAVRSGGWSGTWSRRILIAAPALIPFVWHLALRNHTHFHGWFTYRSFPVAAGMVLMAVTARLAAPAESSAGAVSASEPESVADGPLDAQLQ